MRLRLLFGILGAAACMVAALMAEPVFRWISANRAIDDHVTRVLIYRSDIAHRLDQAGAARGEIEVALDWNNRNDLDLHVIDPHGFEVYFKHPRSVDGGTLDADANWAPEYATKRPVEHIVWPYGRAPLGRYVVRVRYFCNNGDPDPTAYHVEVREEGHIRQYSGRLMPRNEETVCEFDLGHRSGAFSRVLVMLVRAMLITGGWTLLLSTLLATALIGGQQILYRRRYHEPLVVLRRIPGIIGCGTVAGLVAGVLGQILLSGLEMVGGLLPVAVEEGLGWAIVGVGMGVGLARRMPNLPTVDAFGAGLLGGALGCYCFVSTLQTGSDGVGRVAAAGVIGLLIGLMIQLEIESDEPLETIETAAVSLHPMHLRANRVRSAGAVRPPQPPHRRTALTPVPSPNSGRRANSKAPPSPRIGRRGAGG